MKGISFIMLMINILDFINEKGVLEIPNEICISSRNDGLAVITYQIKKIGPNSLDHINKLVELHIPSSVQDIVWCFYECYNLENIYVEESNKSFCSIDGVLFSKDKSTLIAYPNAHGKIYSVPEGTKLIDNFAFKSCKGIEEIHIPSSCTNIGTNAFYRCDNLAKVYLPDNFMCIGDVLGSTRMNMLFVFKGKEYKYEELIKVL